MITSIIHAQQIDEGVPSIEAELFRTGQDVLILTQDGIRRYYRVFPPGEGFPASDEIDVTAVDDEGGIYRADNPAMNNRQYVCSAVQPYTFQYLYGEFLFSIKDLPAQPAQ